MTVLYSSPIFGPIHSRRLGISLGINLMPSDGKVCTFDCIYCECGFNADHRPTLSRPTCEEVTVALEKKLSEMHAEGVRPDVLTFAGNGEPTAHPDFPHIIDSVRTIRDKYCPEAKISVLTNATLITRPDIHQALMSVDNNIVKLDTVCEEYIHAVDRPTGSYSVKDIIEGMRAFDGHCIVQTMFMHSKHDGMSEEYVKPWLNALEYIRPEKVMIYTIDRETPDTTLTKATPDELDSICERVRALGIKCSASY